MKEPNNIIPFPSAPVKPIPSPRRRWNKSLASTVFSMTVVVVAAGISDSAIFQSRYPSERNIASSEDLIRDAAWEKAIAESLASGDRRDMSSVWLGHDASTDEAVRYGV